MLYHDCPNNDDNYYDAVKKNLYSTVKDNIDELMQERRNSSALVPERRHSSTLAMDLRLFLH